MTKEERLHKEVDLIQGIISRMANNSFILKGWVITIVVAILAINKDTIITDDIKYISIVLLLPLITFWYLDAFFLHKERCYRELYKWVINHRLKCDDYLYDLNYARFEDKVEKIRKIMFSKTLIYFYGTPTLILIIITIYNQIF